MSFANLGLIPELLKAVVDEGYTEATPVQAQAIPIILQGRDIMAGAQTGTGKTAGFTLPLLQLLNAKHTRPLPGVRRKIRALILTPTRELAAQVEESVRIYGKHLQLRSTCIFGGVNINPQIHTLQRGVEILVATPGRLLDHLQQRTVDLSTIEILVLDESDRMLDMGFIRDIRKILAVIPQRRQNLLFSATFSEEIKELADAFLHDPAHIEVARRNTACELVSQIVYPVDRERKRELLTHLIKKHDMKQVLVFTRTKHGANRLAEQLERDGISTAAIHGNKSQPQRMKALADFKRGAVRILAATDIAARGLDIDQLPHVVNFELPNVAEDYIHRIGRTGRAGTTGSAISLVCVDELKLLSDIERLLKTRVDREIITGFEPDMSIRPEPIPNGRNGVREQRDPREFRPRMSAPHTPSSGSQRGGAGSGMRGGNSRPPARFATRPNSNRG